MRRSYLNHSQPSDLEVAGDMLVLGLAIAAGVVGGLAALAKGLICDR